MVPPKGERLARARSTWIHWKSSIALAKVSMRSCVDLDPRRDADFLADAALEVPYRQAVGLTHSPWTLRADRTSSVACTSRSRAAATLGSSRVQLDVQRLAGPAHVLDARQAARRFDARRANGHLLQRLTPARASVCVDGAKPGRLRRRLAPIALPGAAQGLGNADLRARRRDMPAGSRRSSSALSRLVGVDLLLRCRCRAAEVGGRRQRSEESRQARPARLEAGRRSAPSPAATSGVARTWAAARPAVRGSTSTARRAALRFRIAEPRRRRVGELDRAGLAVDPAVEIGVRGNRDAEDRHQDILHCTARSARSRACASRGTRSSPLSPRARTAARVKMRVSSSIAAASGSA